MDLISANLIFTVLICVTLFIYWAFNFVIIYHLARFGIGVQPKQFALVFFLGAVGLFFFSVIMFANIDFSVLRDDLVKLANAFLNSSPY